MRAPGSNLLGFRGGRGGSWLRGLEFRVLGLSGAVFSGLAFGSYHFGLSHDMYSSKVTSGNKDS